MHIRTIRLLLLAILALAALPASAAADAPTMASGNGITVSGWRWISNRTFETDISTAKVAASAVNGPHRVRITLPGDYFTSGTTRYPVLYLLHGGAGGNSAQWTTGGGAAESITLNAPLITVMADGGKVGWFTNWIDQSGGAQNWADFYLSQLIPWVDANLRTIAAKSGRAIAGLSMGGFGAIRFAQDRPDLFAYAASFSGAVDLSDSGTRSVIGQQATQNGYSPSAPFGNPFPPFDTTYNQLNPVARAPRLKGVGVGLWVGSGSNGGADPIETTMARAALNLHNALNSAAVPHFYWNYGVQSAFGCDGGHDFGCWNFALNDALPKIMAALQAPPGPQPPAGNVVADPGFEAGGQGPWVCQGTCGNDHGNALAYDGNGDGFVRNTSGWNDIDQTIAVAPNTNYTVTAWIRTSSNNTSGYFGLRTTGGQVLGEQQFGSLGNYTKITQTVNSGANTSLVVYAGLWANGDTWAQVDDVSVTP